MEEHERERLMRRNRGQLGLAPAMAMYSQPQPAPGRSSLTDGLAPATSGAAVDRPYRSLFDGALPWSNAGRKQTPLYAGPASSAPATAAPAHGGAESGIDSKYTYRRNVEFDMHMGPVPAKVQFRFEASLKDRGALHHDVPGKKGDVTWGETQKLLEHSATGLDVKIRTTLMKAKFDLLADGKLPGNLGTLPMVPKVEIKGLEAGLSLKNGAELKLLTLAVYVEGDFSSLLPESSRSNAEIKGQLRIECAVAPDLAKKLVELGRAADAVKRSAAVEAKIAKTERSLSYWRNRKVKDKVKQLEGELTKLRKVRAGVSQARDAALKKITSIGVSLEKTAGGRLVKKLGGKALAVVFKKFIPIYNAISTAQDIYEVGEWLANCDWGSIGDRIVNGGPGGTSFGDGSHDGEESGTGTGQAGAGDGGDVDAEAIERELKQEANPELHATARAVLGTVEKHSGDGGDGTQLSKEDKETLNLVIPWDLTPEEIEAMKARLTTASSQPQDLVTSVIAAIQQVRPLGQQRLGPSKTPVVAANENSSTTKQESTPTNSNDKAVAANEERSTTNQDSARTSRKDEASTPQTRDLDVKKADRTANKPSSPRNLDAKKGDNTANKQPGTWVVDPSETLLRVITADEHGNVTVPEWIQFPGFMAHVTRSGVARFSVGTGEAGSETSFIVTVTIVPQDAQLGRSLRDGRAIVNRTPLPNVMVIVRPNRPSS